MFLRPRPQTTTALLHRLTKPKPTPYPISHRFFFFSTLPPLEMSSDNTNKAAFLETEKGSFVVRDADSATPGDKEVLIKVHACAIQPADAKVAKTAMLKMEYPTILGSPVSGVVEALGTGVSKVSVGDRVVCGTKILVHKKVMYGGLQRFSVVDESEVIPIGKEVAFTKAVTLGSYTPPGALFGSLGMHYPSIPSTPLPASEQGKKILIWGGSSAMGSLSISYAKAAGYTVISTSSPHNFDILKACGADHMFDHSAADTPDKIRALFPIAYFFDTVSLKPTITSMLKVLAPEGKPVTRADVLLLLPLVMTGFKEADFPEGITMRMHRFSTHSPENKAWNEHFLGKGGFMEKGIQAGVIRGVPADVLGGLDKVEEGIDMLDKGVSGRKIVIEPWA